MTSVLLFLLVLSNAILTTLPSHTPDEERRKLAVPFTLTKLQQQDQIHLLGQIRNSAFSIVKSQEEANEAVNLFYAMLGVRGEGQPDLLYIHNPWAGSPTIRRALDQTTKATLISSKDRARELNKNDQTYVFSSLRHPEERILNFFSTIGNREGWEEHFAKIVHDTLKTIELNGWENPYFQWDQLLIPQYEYLRGYNIQHICCTNSLEHCFDPIGGLEGAEFPGNPHVPEKKFEKFDLLMDETKRLFRHLYADDYLLYHTFCGAD